MALKGEGVKYFVKTLLHAEYLNANVTMGVGASKNCPKLRDVISGRFMKSFMDDLWSHLWTIYEVIYGRFP